MPDRQVPKWERAISRHDHSLTSPTSCYFHSLVFVSRIVPFHTCSFLFFSSLGWHDPNDLLSNNARVNSFTPPLNQTWKWGTDRIYGYAPFFSLVIEASLISVGQCELGRMVRFGAFHHPSSFPKISWCGGRMGHFRRHGCGHQPRWRSCTTGESLCNFHRKSSPRAMHVQA